MKIIETNLKFNGLAYGNKPNTIVLHHAEANPCTVEDIHQWHLNRGWAGIGYHFFIRKDGSIYRGRPENAIGAHTLGHNTGSLGICVEGKYMIETMPQVQKQAVIYLCKYLISKYGITKIYAHRELQATDCPGTNYPLDSIKQLAFTEVIATPPITKPSSGNTYDFKTLQKCLGVYQDNIPGPITLSKCPLIKQGATGNVVKWAQARLNILGFNCGAADGIFGSITLASLKRFQKFHGLTTDGIIGPQTWKKLLGL